jgi:hypothetical protein
MEETRPLLDPSAVNLADLALARQDHSEDQTRRFDPVDGTVAPFFSSSIDQPGDQCTQAVVRALSERSKRRSRSTAALDADRQARSLSRRAAAARRR